jgi:MYXO-CTERM domain-containing protein
VEAQVLAVYDYVLPIDDTSPASPVALDECQDAELTVTYPMPDPDSMVVTWRVDGQVVSTGPTTHAIRAEDLGDGSHQVSVEVQDTTALVLNDPQLLLVGEHTWEVEVSASGQGSCQIGAECYAAGEPNPVNPCQECDPAQDPAGWTDDDTNGCEDELFCNGQEFCLAGSCQPGESCPDDGLDCTGDCSEELAVCHPLLDGFCLIDDACFTPGQPDPANPCRHCQPRIDPLTWTVNDEGDCQDGDFCNGTESCQAGTCVPGDPPCEEDAFDCTETCNDELDTCNLLLPEACLIADQCVAEGDLDPDNPCQECQPAQDSGAWTADDSNPCADDLFCNGTESCQAGSCQPGGPPCQDDGLECTDTCDEELDVCNQLLPGHCLIDGSCYAEGSPNPGNPCEACSAAEPAVWTATDSPCDDGNPCTENDTCQASVCSGEAVCSKECPCGKNGGSCSCGADGPSTAWTSLLLGLTVLLARRRRS